MPAFPQGWRRLLQASSGTHEPPVGSSRFSAVISVHLPLRAQAAPVHGHGFALTKLPLNAGLTDVWSVITTMSPVVRFVLI